MREKRDDLLKPLPPPRPLRDIPDGAIAQVVALEGGLEFQNRLTSMGLAVGSQVRVLQSCNGRRGPTLVAVGESRFAVGYGMAGGVLVREGKP